MLTRTVYAKVAFRGCFSLKETATRREGRWQTATGGDDP